MMEPLPLITTMSSAASSETSSMTASNLSTASTPLIDVVTERMSSSTTNDDDNLTMKLRKHHKDDFKKHKKHKYDKFDDFLEWVDGDVTLRYSPKDQDARKHLSGWAMRNTNNHNKKVLKKSCLGVFVCSKRCVGPEGEIVTVRPATSDRARKKQGEKKCTNPECDGHLMHLLCAGKGGYPVTHFWRPMESVIIFQSKGYHDHPRPDVVKTTSSAKMALLEYHRTHRHERPKEICKKIGVHIHKSFSRVDRIARQLREAQNLVGGSDDAGRSASFAYGTNGQQVFHSNPSLEQWYQSSNDMYTYGMSSIYPGSSHDTHGVNGQYSTESYYNGNTHTPVDYSYYSNSVEDVDFGRPSTYFQKSGIANRENDRSDANGKKGTIPLLQNMLKRRQMMKEMKDKTNKLADGQLSDFFDTDKPTDSRREYYEHGAEDSTFGQLSPPKRKAPPLVCHSASVPPKRLRTLSDSDIGNGEDIVHDLSRTGALRESMDCQNTHTTTSTKSFPSDSVSAAAQKLNDNTSGDLPSLLDFFDVRGTTHEPEPTISLKSTNSAFSPTIPSSQRECPPDDTPNSATTPPPPPPPSYSSSILKAVSSSNSAHPVTSSSGVSSLICSKEHAPTSPPTGNDQVFSELTNVSQSYSRGTPEMPQQGPTLSQLTSSSHGYGQDEDNGTYIDLLVSMYLGNNNNMNDKPLSTLKHEFHVYTDTFNKSRAQFMQQDMNQYGYDHYKSNNQYDFASWYESDHWRNHARLATQNYHHGEHTPLSPMPFSAHYDYPSMQYADWYSAAAAADSMGESSRLLMSQALNYSHGNSGILYNRSLF
ncbi:uncharacterized protein LOC144445627 isoform X2 [Glandiceps talaboti]